MEVLKIMHDELANARTCPFSLAVTLESQETLIIKSA